MVVSANKAPIIFGERIKILRKQKGLSQEELALNSGIDRSYLGKIERGESNIALKKIILISNALKIPPKTLFGF